DIGLLQMLGRDDALQVVPDDKTGAVGVGQQNQPPRLRRPAQQILHRLVLHDSKAAGLQNGRVHNLRQRIFIVPALHHNDFPHFNHAPPPGPIAASTAPAAAPARQKKSSFYYRSPKSNPPPGGKTGCEISSLQTSSFWRHSPSTRKSGSGHPRLFPHPEEFGRQKSGAYGRRRRPVWQWVPAASDTSPGACAERPRSFPL